MVIRAHDYVSITLKDGDTCTRLCINHLQRWWYMHNIMYQSPYKMVIHAQDYVSITL